VTDQDPSPRQPLAGILVVELARLIAGPYAAMTLADFGAEVIKVESLAGDETRQGVPTAPGMTALTAAVNRNKRSVALDYTKPPGLRALERLIERADVVIHNFRPGVEKRMGLSYERLSSLNDRLIVCSLSAFGHDGPHVRKPGVDTVFQAMSGIMAMTGERDGMPVKAAPPIVDFATAMSATYAILAALYARMSTGRGQHIQLALGDVAMILQSSFAATYLMTGEVPERTGNESVVSMPVGAFRCADGELIVISIFSDRFYQRFADAVGDPRLAADEFRTNESRVVHSAAMRTLVEEVLARRDAAQWLTLFDEIDVPASLVRSVAQAVDDPQLVVNGLISTVHHPVSGTYRILGSPVHMTETPPSVRRPPPILGEHTVEVLADYLDAEQLKELQDSGLIDTKVHEGPQHVGAYPAAGS
jgi:crotonobetainyl-CoA:carnitine CoA-transferase CaiB-like acyl-CoA transferase